MHHLLRGVLHVGKQYNFYAYRNGTAYYMELELVDRSNDFRRILKSNQVLCDVWVRLT
jgi:hypothetical protein